MFLHTQQELPRVQSLPSLGRKSCHGEQRMSCTVQTYDKSNFSSLKKVKLANLGAEYLILGQHQIGDGYPECIPSTKICESQTDLLVYVDCVCRAIESGVFTYVAHPDIINFVGDDKIYRDEMMRICEASLKRSIPLEINFLGIRKGRRYPNPKFWELAGEAQCPVTFGCDAHEPEAAYDGESLSVAKWLVKRYKLNYIGMPNIIRLN